MTQKSNTWRNQITTKAEQCCSIQFVQFLAQTNYLKQIKLTQNLFKLNFHFPWKYQKEKYLLFWWQEGAAVDGDGESGKTEKVEERRQGQRYRRLWERERWWKTRWVLCISSSPLLTIWSLALSYGIGSYTSFIPLQGGDNFQLRFT